MCIFRDFCSGSVAENLLAVQEPQKTRVQSLGQEDRLDESMPIHPSILAYRIPWTEGTGGLLSKGLQRVGHEERDLNTHVHVHI